MRNCAECGEPSQGVFCLIDFLLLMKELGWDNEMIRKIYKFNRQSADTA